MLNQNNHEKISYMKKGETSWHYLEWARTTWNELELPGTSWKDLEWGGTSNELTKNARILCVQYYLPTKYGFTNSFYHKELCLRCCQGIPDLDLIYVYFKLKITITFNENKLVRKYCDKCLVNHSTISRKKLLK